MCTFVVSACQCLGRHFCLQFIKYPNLINIAVQIVDKQQAVVIGHYHWLPKIVHTFGIMSIFCHINLLKIIVYFFTCLIFSSLDDKCSLGKRDHSFCVSRLQSSRERIIYSEYPAAVTYNNTTINYNYVGYKHSIHNLCK